jgi:DNA-binding response OmpR family regulator
MPSVSPDSEKERGRMQREAVRWLPSPVYESSLPEEGPVVLLVTEDRDLRESAARALTARGYRVLSAAHAGHAVLACMDAGRVDVAAIELSMQDVSGPVLAERLRRRCPTLRSIYLAREGTPECEGILVRPFTRDDLVARLMVSIPAIT